MAATHPFVAIEQRLLDPPTDGVLLTVVEEGSPFAAADARPGDIVVSIDGATEAPDRMAFHESMRSDEEGTAHRTYTVLGMDGARRDLSVALPGRGVAAAGVTRGEPAWLPGEDPDAQADFSGLADGTEILLRNSLEEARAGFEVLRLTRRDALLDVEALFRLGGDDGKGGTWDYHTRSLATLRLERGLPAVRTAHWECGRLVGDLRLEDGAWRGVRGGPNGAEIPVERPATAPVCPAYVATLLPLTMPLREGAQLTHCGAGDGKAIPVARERFECIGRETIQVNGAAVTAWCIVQHHYGLASYGDEERYHVTDDRRLVRVDWGSNYAGCWGEAVPADQLLDGVPSHVTLEGVGCGGEDGS